MMKKSIFSVCLIFFSLSIYGQAIKEIQIGKQIWMAENLNTDKFANGKLLLNASSDEQWVRAGEKKQPAWCYYDNDPVNGARFGKLYNWYAVADTDNICPTGWHVPSDSEWTDLTLFLGGENEAGIKMKSRKGWSGWTGNDESSNGNNQSGFSAIPSGFRPHHTSGFSGIGKIAWWWTSTPADKYPNLAWYRTIGYLDRYVSRSSMIKDYGFSVRCIKNK